MLARMTARVQRLLQRRGLDPGDADFSQADPVAEDSPALAGLSSASIQGRIALGPRAGARVWRVGDDPDAPWVLSTVPRHAHLAGFDVHANVAVPAADRTRLEQLCRYLFRPAVAQDRLRLLDDGRIVLTLKTAWADGTRALVFEPLGCSRSWPRSRHGLGSTSCSTTACSRRMLAGERAWSPTASRRLRRRGGRAPPRTEPTVRRQRRARVTGRGPI